MPIKGRNFSLTDQHLAEFDKQRRHPFAKMGQIQIGSGCGARVRQRLIDAEIALVSMDDTIHAVEPIEFPPETRQEQLHVVGILARLIGH